MNRLYLLVPVLLLAGIFYLVLSSRGESTVPESYPEPLVDDLGPDPAFPAGEPQLATFGSGCFWCTEAYFLQMKGVLKVVSGYSGGQVPNPSYEQICTGTTGHAECIQVTFDPSVVTYAELLEVFWRSHDPTTKNRQGNDAGPQYRSIVFTHSDRQRVLAEKYKTLIDEAKVYAAPVVTIIEPITVFYPAEKYHQNFYALNPKQGYCYSLIRPKLEKLKKVFANKIKDEAK